MFPTLLRASLFALALVVTAAPYPTPQSWSLHDNQLLSFRANCSEQPWHGRHLVQLPTGHRLGLENFTVNPETPPLKFLPIRIRDDDNKFALRGDDIGDDLSRTPYLAALVNEATRTVSMKIVYLPNPLRESFETQTDACPEGYHCSADQWEFSSIASNDDPVYYDLKFAGFKGRWEPFKDAGKEGWHVYWKGNGGLTNPIQLDLVPLLQPGYH